MDKTSKNNPAAFQKVSPSRFLKIIKDTIQQVINGQNTAAINIFRAGLLNYFLKFKRKNQFYCNLCKCESPNFLHTSNENRILFNSICPNCSSRKRHRGLNFISVLGNIFTAIECIDLYKYNDIYHLALGLTPQHDLAFLCRKN